MISLRKVWAATYAELVLGERQTWGLIEGEIKTLTWIVGNDKDLSKEYVRLHQQLLAVALRFLTRVVGV